MTLQIISSFRSSCREEEKPTPLRKTRFNAPIKQHMPTKPQEKNTPPKKGLFGRFKPSNKTRINNKPRNPTSQSATGGAFHCALTRSEPSSRLILMPSDEEDEEEERPQRQRSVSSMTVSMASISTTFSVGSSAPTRKQKWRSSGFDNFHNHSRLIVKPHSRSSEPVNMEEAMEYDEQSELDEVMERSKRLPDTFCYANNVIMVNNDRIKNGVAPLIRRSELDEVARQQAKKMANNETVEHSEPEVLEEAITAAFKKDDDVMVAPCRRLGENVASGSSIRIIHIRMRSNVADKNNMLDRRYTHMGMGTARGADGRLYMCQIFKG